MLKIIDYGLINKKIKEIELMCEKRLNDMKIILSLIIIMKVII